VIGFRSPDDRLRPLQEKMEEYIANGVELGWLIDPKKRGRHDLLERRAAARTRESPFNRRRGRWRDSS
jgi:Uma2 family endonuclease